MCPWKHEHRAIKQYRPWDRCRSWVSSTRPALDLSTEADYSEWYFRYFPRSLPGRLQKNTANYAITTVNTRVPCTLCSECGSAIPCICIGEWWVVSGDPHAPVTSPLREIALGTHPIGDWVSPRASLGAALNSKISFPCWGSNCNCPTHSLTILTELFWVVSRQNSCEHICAASSKCLTWTYFEPQW
jgi:hypothetical protein